MEKDLPDLKTPESIQGDRLHDYSAHPEYERQLLTPEEQDLLRTADQLEAQALDAIALMGSYIEHREIDIGNDLIGGHPDLLRVYGGSKETPLGTTSIILDRKFGWGDVDRAADNLQMRSYAILAPTDDVYVGILQPRAYGSDRLTMAHYSAETKEAAFRQISKIITDSDPILSPEAPLNPSEDACRFCRARAICPALARAVKNELMPPAFVDLSGDLSKPAKLGRIIAKLATASDEQLGAMLSVVGLAGLVNDPLRDEIRRRINAGQMKGYSLGKDYEVRNITSARKAVSRMALGSIMTRDQGLDLCKIDVGAITSKYRSLHKGMTEKQANEDVNRALADVIQLEQRKGKILKNAK